MGVVYERGNVFIKTINVRKPRKLGKANVNLSFLNCELDVDEE